MVVKGWVKFSTNTFKKKDDITIDCSKYRAYNVPVPKKLWSNTNHISGVYNILEGLKTRNGYIRKYIDFNTFEEKETKIPKNAKLNNRLSKRLLKNRCDISKKLLQKNNELYSMIKKKLKGYKSYYTHNNGGRPFLVYVNKSNVYIYKMNEDTYYTLEKDYSKDSTKNKWVYVEFVKQYKPLKVFIGKSPKNDMTLFSGGYGKKFDGNSILLQIEKNKYVHIGINIYEFITNDTILKYISPVGNNDVPYPVAYGEKNIYFILHKKYIEYKNAEELKNMNNTNPYKYYYGHKGEKLSKYSKTMKSVKVIHKDIW